MCHTGRRRRIEGGQREDEGRGSKWGGRGGGGDVCQGGWLGSTLAGAEGRQKVSQAILISLDSFISLCLFLSLRFHTTSGLTLSFFSLFNTNIGFLTLPPFLLPVQALCILIFHPFLSFLSFHCFLFVCVLNHVFIAVAGCEICASAV